MFSDTFYVRWEKTRLCVARLIYRLWTNKLWPLQVVAVVTYQIHPFLSTHLTRLRIVMPPNFWEPSNMNLLHIGIKLHYFLILSSAKLWTIDDKNMTIIVGDAFDCNTWIPFLFLPCYDRQQDSLTTWRGQGPSNHRPQGVQRTHNISWHDIRSSTMSLTALLFR